MQFVEYRSLLTSLPFLTLNGMKNIFLSIFYKIMIHYTKFDYKF